MLNYSCAVFVVLLCFHFTFVSVNGHTYPRHNHEIFRRIGSLERKINTQDTEIVKLKDIINTQKEEIMHMKSNIHYDDVMQLKNIIKNQNEEMTQLKNKCNNQFEDILQLKNKSSIQEEEVMQIKNIINNQNEEISQLKNNCNNHYEDILQLKNKSFIQEEEVMQLKSNIKIQDDDIMQLKNTTNIHYTDIMELKNNIHTQDEDMMQLKNIKTGDEDIMQLKNDIKAIDENISKLENKNRVFGNTLYRNNEQKVRHILVFTNVEDTEKSYKDLLQKVLDIINVKMSLKIDFTKIADVHRDNSDVVLQSLANGDEDINPPCDSSSCLHPVVVTFVNHLDKWLVLISKNNLKDTNIKVSDVYSECTITRRNALRPFLKEARERGLRAELEYDTLVVNGVKKTLEQLQAGRPMAESGFC